MHGTHNSVPAPSQAGGSFESQRESLFASLQRSACEPTTFREFWNAGFRRLVPVVPPGAVVSERSVLAKRPQEIGKIPGIRGANGWYSFDWLKCEADERDLARWESMNAGVGIKTGNGLVLIDADTLNADHATTIAKLVEHHFGQLAIRIGKSPKAGYLLRVFEDVPYQRVEFGERNSAGRLTDRVEILSNDRFFVAHGIHRDTGRPYVWSRFTTFDQTPIATPSQVTAFLEAVRAALPAAEPIFTEGAASGKSYNQEALKGNLDLVTRAVRAIPNTAEHFPTRESYRDFGYAIKSALADHPAEAFDLFQEWCAETDWTDKDGNGNDPATVEKDWRGMIPPYRRGAGWLYELAEQRSPGKFNAAARWFEPVTVHESLFGEMQSEHAEVVKLDPIDVTKWDGVKPQPRKWVVADVVPDHEVSLLTGAGGVGKTLLAQMAATCITAGIPFLGREVSQRKVTLFLCEDSEDELHRRQADINASLGLSMADIAPGLQLFSRKFMDNLLSVWDRNKGAMKRTAVWAALHDRVVAFGSTFIVIDTIADTFGGSEIDRAQVRQFVQGCLGRLAQETNGAVLALGHPSRAGQSSGDGTSGSTAWHASVRSRLYLDYTTKDTSGPFRKLTNKKANYGPAGDQWMLRWARGAFEVVSAVAPDSDRVEAAMADIEKGDWLWSSTSPTRWVGIPIAIAFSLDLETPDGKDEAKRIAGHLLQAGRIEKKMERDSEGSRKLREFVRVIRKPVERPPQECMSDVLS